VRRDGVPHARIPLGVEANASGLERLAEAADPREEFYRSLNGHGHRLSFCGGLIRSQERGYIRTYRSAIGVCTNIRKQA